LNFALSKSDSGTSRVKKPATGNWRCRRKMLCDVVDDQFLTKYRALLDAEDEAFDELEHAYEDGDRAHFDTDLNAWRAAVERKLSYLHRLGLVSPPALTH